MQDNLPVPYNPQQPAPMDPQEEKMWTIGAHLSTLSGGLIPLGNILGPLVIWLVKKDQSAMINHHAKDALNFQITMTIAASVSALLSIILIGIPLLIGICLFSIVVTVIAAVKASNGEHYQYPMTIKFIQ